jgi:PadR family transcriptional regulator PadR
MTGPVRVTGPLLDVLEVLVEAFDEAEPHGWAIMKATKRSGPTVYGVLDRLEDADWVTGRWEEQTAAASRPRRRFYRLTPTGRERASALLAARRPRPQPASPGPPRLGLVFRARLPGVAGGGR